MKKTLTFLFSLFISSLYAQLFIEWKQNLGQEHYHFPSDFEETTDGGFIFTGWTDEIDLGACWVVKLNADRTIAWEKTFGGSAADGGVAIHHTSDGGYILGAETQSSDGDVSGHNGGRDFWIVKLDASGNIEWQRALGGVGDDILDAVQQTSDGGYIACGRTDSENIPGFQGLSDIWVVKLGSTGNVEWSKTLGGSGKEFMSDVLQATDGGFVITTETDSADGDITESLGQSDGWVVKLDATGAIEWQKSFGGSSDDALRYIDHSSDGGYILGGFTDSTDGDVTSNYGHHDCWVVKISAEGALEWQRTFGGSHGEIITALKSASDNGVVFSAISLSNDGQVGINYGDIDCWIVKLDGSGNLVWQGLFGGSQLDRVNNIRETSDGGIGFVAYIASPDGDFPWIPPRSNAWIVKLNGTSDTEGPLPLSSSHLAIFPNPTSGFLNVTLPKGVNRAQATLFDAGGKILYSKSIDSFGNMDISDLPSGVYLFTVVDQNGVGYSEKILKQ